MQLAITVVYLVQEHDGPLLDLHLRQIERCTDVPYLIYAAAPRLRPEFLDALRARRDVKLCDCPRTDVVGTGENSHYLTHLAAQALADGATHLALLHVDSFPVQVGWAGLLDAKLRAGGLALAGVVREGEDPPLRPLTAGLLAPRRFYDEHGPLLSLEHMLADPAGNEYLGRLPYMDSGDAHGYLLARAGLKWAPLSRSNATNDHALIAGIYGDLIFHLGGAAGGFAYAAVPWLGAPARQSRGIRLLKRLLPAGLRERVQRCLFQDRNQRDYQRIRARLLADPEAYLARLRGVG